MITKDEVIVGRASILEIMLNNRVNNLSEILSKYDRKVIDYGKETFAPVVKILKQ
jgi:hypothetical protein